ncbi:MAG: hypothetical protein ACE5DS_04060, partial [Kiloniellaceae bacterium]
MTGASLHARARRWLVAVGLACLAGAAGASARAGELTIGLTQFPSTLNPQIDYMLAKSYVLAMTMRPITA